MAEATEIRCPQCGALMSGPAGVCTCGHSFYPRPDPNPPRWKRPKPTPEQRRESNAVGGLIVGILSFVWPIGTFYGVMFPFIAIALSIHGLKSKNRRKAVAGIACACSAIVIWCVIVLVFTSQIQHFFRG